jgi:glutamyl-tRNA reductase
VHLVLVGLSHHQAPIEVRERLSCPEHALPEALAAAAAGPGVRETVILSTCNRTEWYAVAEGADTAAIYAAMRRHLADFHRVPEPDFAPYLYGKAEQEAALHLLQVAAGLDSLVLGEAQILGQVREALRAAQAAGTSGSALTALFQQAILSGKRVHTETGLGRGAFSIGHAAVDLASSIFSEMSHASVLILGAGKMSELTARHLVQSGVKFVIVANRTYDRAVALAERLGGRAIQYDTFPEALVTADIVLSSTAAPHPILHRQTLQPVMRRRRGRPLFLIDIAVPRDIDADVQELDNVFLYNIDDLQAVVAEEARSRAGEAEKAREIAVEEAMKFLAWYRSREAAPVINQLRDRLEQIRQDDLAVLRARLGHLSEREWQAIEAATRAMMNKVAREPILRLKRAAGESPGGASDVVGYDLIAAAREIFGLEARGSASGTEEVPTASPDSEGEVSGETEDAEAPRRRAEVT